MKKVVRNVARFFLWIVTGVTSFAIAACYGVMYAYQRTGRVTDAVTHAGIDGIQVNCLVGGVVHSGSSTYDGGRFYLDYDSPCDQVQFTDVDGATNGSYLPRTVAPPPSGELDVELTPGP
ncbi:MAG: hypothetical protein HY907_19605 [Deltaproteobacteria bacterium]|nr:hypothetical protein [Deltaproteobacteria bacterium]